MDTKKLLERLDALLTFSDERWKKGKPDAISLYFLYWKSRDKKTKLSMSTVPNSALQLSISAKRTRIAKHILEKLGMIKTQIKRDDKGVVRHYIELT